MRSFGYLALGFVLVMGCTPAAPVLPDAGEDSCGATNYAALVGQDATALEKTLILGMVRVIRPGDIVTMDFRSARINFAIGADETITRIYCG
ncbi:I78 family peptidase inhibitor [Yoonia sp. BS5-3]|uniref:I78 family peptidase inhibitor n=1 Tax=Yoonia phaeophyticola TaxID=3137369 RepID=A0ABZ2V5M3_9RHOB